LISCLKELALTVNSKTVSNSFHRES